MKNLSKLSLVVAFQLSILLLLILSKYLIFANGTEIYLRIEPYDPRDPLRGDFAVFQFKDLSSVPTFYLNLDFSLQPLKYEEQPAISYGQTVYVLLRSNGLFSGPANISLKKPESGLFIKGQAQSEFIPGSANAGSTNLRVVYGIEEYFIPENSGRNANFGDNAFAVVKVDKDGNPVLVKIIVDGKDWP